MTQIRLTTDGKVVAGLAVALTGVASLSGNNLLVLVVGVLWAILVIDTLVGGWNIRNLTVFRAMPDELFADTDGVGRLVVSNRRRWLPAVAIWVEDLGTTAYGLVGEIAPQGQQSTTACWRFSHRGAFRLAGLQVRSGFPFGLIEHAREVRAAVNLLVYPRPLGVAVRPVGVDGQGAEDTDRGGTGTGEFDGIRPYRSGDRKMQVHWRTSARTQQLMVVVRAGDSEPEIRVRLRKVSPAAWEAEVGRATGEVVRAFSRGFRVGLDLPGDVSQPARSGMRWRRALLETLAVLPVSP